MSELTVTARTRQGVFSLLGRQLITFPISFFAGVLLARLLGPADFGTYASVSFLVMGAGVLLDVGLGAIIIQQAEEPTPEQLKSIFTAQLLVFGTATVFVMLTAHWLAGAFKLQGEGAWMLRAMVLNMLIGTLGTNSTLLLERHLKFQTFAKLDVFTVLLERAITLSLAYSGFGAWSFVLGSLGSMTARVTLLYRSAPWPVGLAFDRGLLRRALGFGVALQATNLTSLARDNMNTLLGGSLFGPRAVGYLNWGMSLSSTCSQPLVQIIGRVCFPAFSRLHDQVEARAGMLATTLRLVNSATFPILMLLPVLGPDLVTCVFGEPWRPGLMALGCFAFRYMAANVTSTLIGYLNATDRARVGLRVSLVWTAVEWGMGVPLALWLGFNGIAIAYGLGVLVPVVWLLAGVRGEVAIPYGRAFGVPLALGAVGMAVAWVLGPLAVNSLSLAAVAAASAAVPYAVVLYLERGQVASLLASRRMPAPAPVEAP